MRRTARLSSLVVIIVLADYVPAPAMTILLAGYVLWNVLEHSRTVPWALWRLLWIPGVLALLGLHGFLVHDHVVAAKDLWRFGKVPLIIASGYLWARRSPSVAETLRPFVVAAGIACALYVGARAWGQELKEVAFGPLGQEYGRAPFSSFVGAAILLVGPICRVRLTHLSPIVRAVTLGLCLAALAFSQSRTLIGATALAPVLAVLTRAPRRVQALAAGAVVATIIGVAQYSPGYVVEPEVEHILIRTTASLEELTGRVFGNHPRASQYWRTYESSVAWRAYVEGRPLHLVLGQGFGKTVDIGRSMPLLGEDRLTRAIPVLHNGYLYLLLKTGAVGMVLYLLFFFRLIRAGRSREHDERDLRFARLLRALMAVVLVLATFVVSGVLSRHALFPVLVLVGALSAVLDRSDASVALAPPTSLTVPGSG